MEYRLLGRTGLKVSPLCMGTMSFGGDADDDQSARMYTACRERGINFFDSADAYNKGRAEQVLGRLMAAERDDLVIASKCFNPVAADVNSGGGNRRHLPRAVEASLKRLGTDRLDILLMHQWDHNTPLDDTLRGLEDLVREGKVIYLGASNYAAWQVAKALGIAGHRQWSRLDVIQPMYNLVKRQVETELLPLARAEKLGVMTYSPVGGGLLSGKYGRVKRPDSGRLLDHEGYKSRYGPSWMYETAELFCQYAAEHHVHPVTLAVAWVGTHADVTSPIIGARSLEQLTSSLDALAFDMDSAMRNEIAALSRTPPPATDRLEEQT